MQDGQSQGQFSASRRIVGGALIRSAGEILSKLASVAFYVMIARELGEAPFGDFIFGLSLTSVLLVIAGLGTEELVARELARDRSLIHDFFRDVLALKAVALVVLWFVVIAIVMVGDHGGDTRLAVILIGAGVGIEYQTKSYYAVFQAREAQQYIAYSLVIQRFATSIVGIAALMAGASLVEVCVIFVAGSVLGLLAARRWLHTRVTRPAGQIDRSRWMELAKRSAPLGLATVIYLALIRLDATLIGFLEGGADNSAVGHYGAAFRLVDATMFLSIAFGGAILPWFSRHTENTTVPLARGYELGLKLLAGVLLPIGAFYVLFAPELIDLLYGPEFGDAVVPLRILGAMTVLFGLNSYVSIVLVARNRVWEFTRPAAIVLVQNLAFNLVLIPKYGAAGAAANAVISGVLLAAMTLKKTGTSFGGVSILGALATPVAATLGMACVAFAVGGFLWPAAGALALVSYLVVFVAFDRIVFPEDFSFYVRALGRGRSDPT